MTQGYITLATGAARYYEMALNVALSVKLKDPSRPIALIHDGARDLSPYEAHFDTVVTMPPDEDYVGVANKLRLYDYLPYDECLFLDGDTLVVKSDMDRHWAKLGVAGFMFAADQKTEGRWYDFDIAEACAALSVPFIASGNTGVMFFRRSGEGARVHDAANDLYRNARGILGMVHQGRDRQYSDEPFYGAAMGRCGIAPVGYTADEGSVMVTSWRAKRHEADWDKDRSVVVKPDGFRIAGRLWAKGYTEHSPSVQHFIGLKPRAEYDRLTRELRAKFGVAPAEL